MSYNFSNPYDASANAAMSTSSATTSTTGSSALLGLSAASSSTNYTMTEATSTTSQSLTSLLNSAITTPSNSILPTTSTVSGSSSGLTVSQVLNAVGSGINSPVSSTNPTVYNNGISSANSIVAAVNGGNTNVSGLVSSNLSSLSALNYAETIAASVISAVTGSNNASPYAMDLFSLAPKYSFMFVVEFSFVAGFEAMGQLNGQRSKFAMVIQEFDRPKIDYEFDECNWYNFRSKVPKRVIHGNLRLKMIDDRQNASMNFITQYLVASSPIMGISQASAFMYEEAGMNWATSGTTIAYDAINSASFRGFAGSQLNAISEIKVYHVYDYGAYMNIYHFIRPKILGVEMDQWLQQGSAEHGTISAEFSYDGLNIETAVPMTSAGQSKIELLSDAYQYPMTPLQVSSLTSASMAAAISSV